jgi:hypothetical protein
LEIGRWTAGALAAAGIVAGAQPGAAATATASFGVSATVVARCTVAPTLWTRGPVCLKTSGQAIPLAAPPVVSLGRDPETGTMIKTITF